MIKKLTFVLFCLLLSIPMFAQEKELPHHMSHEEKAMMPAYLQTIQNKGISSPPTGHIRTMAEWEEVQAMTISWKSYYTVLAEIVRYGQNECTVIINCSDSTQVKNYLISKGVIPTNVVYNMVDANSVWIRDYGAQSIYIKSNDSLALVDWTYNRPRPKDDTIPESHARILDVNIYTTTGNNTLVNTGGNFMVDGYGTAFCSHLVSDENQNLNNAQIDTMMKHFMGIDRYIKMSTLPYDGIHHIDMHMKLLDEETLMIGTYPNGIADGPQIEANLLYVLNDFKSVFGTYYKVVRIPMPPDNNYNFMYPHQGGDYLTYTNSLIVNKTVLVPQYYEQYDTTALRIYRDAMPGYNVVGINSSITIPASGSIHCITNAMGVEDPLLIKHQALQTMIAIKNGLTVEAKISHRSGIASARVGYRHDTTVAYSYLPMTFNSGSGQWEATLPSPSTGQILNYYYYIEATANSGKVQTRPIPAPQGYWNFIYGSSNVANISNEIQLKPAFPNPSKGITCIPVDIENAQALQVNLYDVHGRLVKEIFSGEGRSGEQNIFVNTLDITSGAYMIRVTTNSSMQSQILIVR